MGCAYGMAVVWRCILRKAEIRLRWDLNPGPLFFTTGKTLRYSVHLSKLFTGVAPNLGAGFLFSKSHGSVRCGNYFLDNRTVRYGGDSSLGFSYRTMRCGLKSCRAAWFSKTRRNTHHTVPALQKSTTKWLLKACLLYTSPSPRDKRQSRMPSSA